MNPRSNSGRGRVAAPALVRALSTEWVTAREVADATGYTPKTVRRSLPECRGVEGVLSPEGWLFRRRDTTPTHAVS